MSIDECQFCHSPLRRDGRSVDERDGERAPFPSGGRLICVKCESEMSPTLMSALGIGGPFELFWKCSCGHIAFTATSDASAE